MAARSRPEWQNRSICAQTPENAHYLDHATTLMDPSRELEWATAINTKKAAPARLHFQASRISVAPILGQLSTDRKILARHGIWHAAFRCAAAGGHKHWHDVRHTYVPLAPGEIENHDAICRVLHACSGRSCRKWTTCGSKMARSLWKTAQRRNKYGSPRPLTCANATPPKRRLLAFVPPEPRPVTY